MKEQRDRLFMDGIVTAAFRGGLFSVETESGNVLMAKPSGKIQKNLIKIIIGDKVTVEISPYDPEKGRIVQRTK